RAIEIDSTLVASPTWGILARMVALCGPETASHQMEARHPGPKFPVNRQPSRVRRRDCCEEGPAHDRVILGALGPRESVLCNLRCIFISPNSRPWRPLVAPGTA